MKTVIEKSYRLLIPLLFAFPLFKENISSMVFIALSVVTITDAILNKSYKGFKYPYLALLLPFCAVLYGCLVHFEPSTGFKPLRQALFFLLFPLIFAGMPAHHFTYKKLTLYLDILKNCCLIISVGYVAAFLIKYDYNDFFVFRYEIPKFRDFVYYEIPVFKIHPTYFTSIVLLCTAFSFHKAISLKKYSELLYVAVFIIITFMLLAKINMVMTVAVITYMLLFRTQFSIKLKVTSVIALIIVVGVLIFTVPGIKYRFAEMVKSFNKPPSGMAYDSTNIRVAITKCNYELIGNNWLTGVGFENVQTELNQCFKANYNSGFYSAGYMSHNYYAYIFIATGIIGFLILAGYMLYVLLLLKRINSFLLTVAIINVFVICLTEDFFYRHYGNFYYHLILLSFIKYWQGSHSTPQLQGQIRL